MKILLISTSLLYTPPRFYGGQEQVVSDLAEYLLTEGYDVTIAAIKGSQVPKGVKLLETIDRPSKFENLAFLKYWDKLENYDLCHDNSHAKYSYSVFVQDPSRFKFLTTLHSSSSIRYPLKRPNLVCLSKSHSQLIWEIYGYRSHVVYNGINIDRYEYSEKKSDRFIFLGRPNREKGVIEAIDFCKEMNVPLDVVGGMLEKMTRYAVKVAKRCPTGSKWKFWGQVTHKKKVELLKNAKALLFPLNWLEPFGLVVIEALACGTPVITYNKGSMPEIVKHGKTGFVVQSPMGIKRAMTMVDQIDPSDCRKDVEERWTVERMGKDYIKEYSRVMDGDRW